ncbi:MAG: hypothetical protein QF632_04360 [Candidatus Woesearchaeota archaeon]|jgi:hypothetical protein|nr:hypothetical protein [Candidatus Woesearchaeota archaeon]
MGEDDYEIVPHKEIIDLKNELKNLKGGEHDSDISFHTSMDNLQLSINSLIDIFREASRSMKAEQDHNEEVLKKVNTLSENLHDVLNQNEKIAEGIVAVADMMKELKGHPSAPAHHDKPMAPPVRPSAPPPFGAPGPAPPMGPPGAPMAPAGPPPMPPPMQAPGGPMPQGVTASPAPPPKKGLF